MTLGRRSWKIGLGWTMSLGLMWVTVTAQEQAAFVQYRQKLMESTGANFQAIGEILRNQLPLAPAHVATHARAVSEGSLLIQAAFEKEIHIGKTDAKPEIWQQWPLFLEEVKKFQTESAALAKMVESNENAAVLNQQAQKVAGSCRSCHRTFKKPKEESYKNQSD